MGFLKNEDARLAYELAVGHRVSDNHWYRTRKLLEKHQLALTTENIQFFVSLRSLVSKSAVGVSGLLDAYHRANKLLGKNYKPIKGSEVLGILSQFGITAHQSTVSRWFKKSAGGYKRDREYQAKQLEGILINAFLYKASTSQKLPEVI